MIEKISYFLSEYKPILDCLYIISSFLLIIITWIYANYTRRILKLSKKQLDLNYRPVLIIKIDSRTPGEISENNRKHQYIINWGFDKGHFNEWVLNLFLLQNISTTSAIEIYIRSSIIKKENESFKTIIYFDLSSNYIENILPNEKYIIKILLNNDNNEKLIELFNKPDLYLFFEVKYQSIRNEIFISRKKFPIKIIKKPRKNFNLGNIIDDKTRKIEFEIIDKNI